MNISLFISKKEKSMLLRVWNIVIKNWAFGWRRWAVTGLVIGVTGEIRPKTNNKAFPIFPQDVIDLFCRKNAEK